MTEQEERDQIAAQLDTLIALAGTFMRAEEFATQLPLPRPFSSTQRPIYDAWAKAS